MTESMSRPSPRGFAGLFLAAGLGSRLMPITADKPKALVEVGGETMLDRLVHQCIERGMTEAVVVTGHGHEAVERWREAAALPIPVTLVYNPQFDTLGNAHSVFVARDVLRGRDFVKFDADIVLDGRILDLLLDPTKGAESCIVLDSDGAVDEEAMKAKTDSAGWVVAMGKWLSLREAAGESIGVEKIAAADADAFFEAIEQVVHVEGRGHVYYEDVYHRMVGDGWRLGAVHLGGLGWGEIDTPADFDAVAAKMASFQR